MSEEIINDEDIRQNLSVANTLINRSDVVFGFNSSVRRDEYLRDRKFWDVWPKPPPAKKRRLNYD